MATQITITTPTFLPNASEGIEIKARTKAGGNPFNDTLEMYFARQETMLEVLGTPTTQRNGVFIPTGRVNSEYDNMIYFIKIKSDYANKTYNKVYFANISGYDNPLFYSTDLFYGQSTGRTKENTVMWLGSQWQYNRPSNWSINKEIIFSLSAADTSWTVVNSSVIDTTPITGVEGDFLTDEKIIMGGHSLSSYRTYTGTSNRYSQSYIPVIISKYTGAKVAEVDTDGKYTGNIVDITGDIYIMTNPYNLFTAVSTSYRDSEDGTKAFMNLFADVPDFIMKKEDIQVNGFVWPDYPTVRSLNLINRQAFINYMNTIGIPWTFEDTVAVNGTIDQMTDYDPDYEYKDPSAPLPGQGNNTTSDWTGAGDNNEDSFELTVPHFSPYGSVVNQYAMSALQVQQFIDELFKGSWITNPDLLNNDPKEGLVSCRYYPFNIRFHDPEGIGDTENIVVGAVEMQYSAGAKILPSYNQILDLGEFKVDEYFGGFLDYQLTTIDIYLPYIGWQQMTANALMGRTLKIKYIVDIISGDCSCLLTTTDGNIERVENIFSGRMGIDIPILTSNHNENTKQAASSVLSAVTAVGGAIATYATGGIGGIAAAGISAAAITNSATDIATMQNHANMGTPISSSSALWMPQDIIFRITRPRKSEATEFKNRQGYRANFSTPLSQVSGYCQVDRPRLDIIATDREKEELKTLLQGGIYL